MSKLLIVTANPKPKERSYSLSVAEEFKNAYQAANPGDQIEELDLYQVKLPQLDTVGLAANEKFLMTRSTEELSVEEGAQLERIFAFTHQFMAADKVVFVNPMWNFSVPPKLRSYIDLIIVAGKTFTYDKEVGIKSLIPGKKALHIQSSGSVFSEGPMVELDFAGRYIKTIFQIFGFDTTQLLLEGTNGDKDGSKKTQWLEEARAIAVGF
jgi:FMN-dependent NADH-azoreductase